MNDGSKPRDLELKQVAVVATSGVFNPESVSATFPTAVLRLALGPDSLPPPESNHDRRMSVALGSAERKFALGTLARCSLGRTAPHPVAV